VQGLANIQDRSQTNRPISHWTSESQSARLRCNGEIGDAEKASAEFYGAFAPSTFIRRKTFQMIATEWQKWRLFKDWRHDEQRLAEAETIVLLNLSPSAHVMLNAFIAVMLPWGDYFLCVRKYCS
jgi:hypothetical protein